MGEANPTTRVKFEVETEDLEYLQGYAKELGCVDTRVIKAEDLYYKEGIRRKCEYPNCASYGNTFQCPPYTPRKDYMRQCIPDSYAYGIFGVLYAPRDAVSTPADGNIMESFYNAGLWSGKVNKIVGKLESKAHELGYYKAMGFNCGPCTCCGMWMKKWYEDLFTTGSPGVCTVIRGKLCKSHRRARPSAEPAGVDMAEFIRDAGLASEYLIFPESAPDCVPECPYYAFVLIG